MAVAAVERWPFQRGLKKSQCRDCPAGTKTSGRCRAVAVSAGSTKLNGKFNYVLPGASILRAEVLLVTPTITLLNTIYRRNIKWTGTLRHVLQTTIND